MVAKLRLFEPLHAALELSEKLYICFFLFLYQSILNIVK